MTHETRVRAVAVAFGATLVVVGMLGMGLVAWRRSRMTIPTINDLLSLWPTAAVGFTFCVVATLVFLYVMRRHILDDVPDTRAPRRRDRFE